VMVPRKLRCQCSTDQDHKNRKLSAGSKTIV
jgi:hypothetical protein